MKAESHCCCRCGLLQFAPRTDRLLRRQNISNWLSVLGFLCRSQLLPGSCRAESFHHPLCPSYPLQRMARGQAAQEWPSSGPCCLRSHFYGKTFQAQTPDCTNISEHVLSNCDLIHQQPRVHPSERLHIESSERQERPSIVIEWNYVIAHLQRVGDQQVSCIQPLPWEWDHHWIVPSVHPGRIDVLERIRNLVIGYEREEVGLLLPFMHN